MAAKSLNESRKAVTAMMVGLMFIGAVVVSSGGWVARAFTNAGVLPELEAREAFFVASELLSHPGVFGLILAAMTAALMSTLDTLITAVSAVTVNDVYKPYFRPKATDPQLLRAARIAAFSVTIFGILMVPVYMEFTSIYAAHAAFTAAVAPPMVVVLLFAVFWRRFTRLAAIWTLVGGLFAIFVSMLFPAIINPFAHGVPGGSVSWDFFAGMRDQPFMRALYGAVVCAVIGVVVTLFTRPESMEKQRGLVWGTIGDALRHYKGSPGKESPVTVAMANPRLLDEELPHFGTAELAGVRISQSVALLLKAQVGDLVYITDSRKWKGGLRSAHVIVSDIVEDEGEPIVAMDPDAYQSVTGRRPNKPVRLERLYESIAED